MKKKVTSKKRIKVLHKVAELVENFNPDNEDIYYKHFFNLFRKIINYEHATVFNFNDETKKLEIIASTGKIVDLINDFSFDYGNGISGWNAKKRKILILNEMTSYNRTKDLSVKSFLSLPLILGKRIIGLINFSQSYHNAFKNTDIKNLEILTPLLAAVLSKNAYIQELKNQKDKIEEMHFKLINTQKQLLQAEKKTAISATISSLNHEINNPLMIISGYIQIIESYLSEGQSDYQSKFKDKIQSINDQIFRISDILKTLRELDNPEFESYIHDGKVDKILCIKKKGII